MWVCAMTQVQYRHEMDKAEFEEYCSTLEREGNEREWMDR